MTLPDLGHSFLIRPSSFKSIRRGLWLSLDRSECQQLSFLFFVDAATYREVLRIYDTFVCLSLSFTVVVKMSVEPPIGHARCHWASMSVARRCRTLQIEWITRIFVFMDLTCCKGSRFPISPCILPPVWLLLDLHTSVPTAPDFFQVAFHVQLICG